MPAISPGTIGGVRGVAAAWTASFWILVIPGILVRGQAHPVWRRTAPSLRLEIPSCRRWCGLRIGGSYPRNPGLGCGLGFGWGR